MKKDLISLGLTRLAMFLMTLLSLPIIIRGLGDENYGLYVLIFGLINILTGFSNLGLGFTAMRGLPSCKESGHREELFYPQFFMHISIGLFLGLLVYMLGTYSKYGQFFIESDVSLWLISLYIMSYPLYMQLNLLFKFTQAVPKLNFINILLPATYLASLGIYFFLYQEITINDMFKSHLISVLFTVFLGLIASCKIINFKAIFYNWNEFIFDLRHGVPLIIASVLDQVMSLADRYILSFYLPLESVGYYVLASTVASMVVMVPKVFTLVSQPLVSKLIDLKRLDDVSSKVNKLSIIWLAIVIPSIVGSYLLGGQMIGIYISTSMGKSAGPIVWILMIGISFLGLFFTYNVILFALSKTDLLLKISLLTAITNVVLNFTLLYIDTSLEMAALATSLSYGLAFFITYSYCKNFLYLQPDFNEIYKIIISALMAGVSVFISMFTITAEIGLIEVLLLISQYIFFYILILILFNSKLTKFKLLKKTWKAL